MARRKTLERYLNTPAASVSDMGEVVAAVAGDGPAGAALVRLAPGWAGSFAQLVTAVFEVTSPDYRDALAFAFALSRVAEERSEALVFAGAAAREADWPIRVALTDASAAVDALRQRDAPCAGCGATAGPWAQTVFRGIVPSFFLERWCRTCRYVSRADRQAAGEELVDVDAVWAAHGVPRPFAGAPF